MNHSRFFLGALVLASGWPTASDGDTVVLRTPGDYPTIRAALDSVSDSAPDHRYEIRLNAGTYQEQVALNKPYVTLRGAGRESTTISINAFTGDAAYSGSLMTMSSGLEVADLTLENTHFHGFEPGIALSNANTRSQAVFRNVRFTTPAKDTLWLSGDSDYEFYDCRIEGLYDIVSVYSSILLFDRCELEISRSGQAIFWLGGGPGQRTFIGHSQLIAPTSNNFLSIHQTGADGSSIYLHDSNLVSLSGGTISLTSPYDRYLTIVTVTTGPSAARRRWQQYE